MKNSQIDFIPKVPKGEGWEGVGGDLEKFSSKSGYLIGNLPLAKVVTMFLVLTNRQTNLA